MSRLNVLTREAAFRLLLNYVRYYLLFAVFIPFLIKDFIPRGKVASFQDVRAVGMDETQF